MSFWEGRRVFVTGHTGFIGGWLCTWLLRQGAQVCGLGLKPPSQPNLFETLGLSERMESVIADIRDRVLLSRTLQYVAPEVVFHLAAQPIVRVAYKEPLETLEVNIMGTASLLEAVRSIASVRSVVVFTSDKVYDNQEWEWGYRENDRLGGREPYGVSKACVEMVTEAYCRSYFDGHPGRIGVATVRAGNVVGGGDWAEDRLVPDAVRAFSSDEPLRVRNAPAVRPWQHVLEVACGALVLGERLTEDPAGASGPWNFGPAQPAVSNVATMAEMLTRAWGGRARWEKVDDDAHYEAMYLTVSSAKAASRLGWRTVWDLEETVHATVDWYRGSYGGKDMHQVTLQQIEAYTALGRESGAAMPGG